MFPNFFRFPADLRLREFMNHTIDDFHFVEQGFLMADWSHKMSCMRIHISG